MCYAIFVCFLTVPCGLKKLSSQTGFKLEPLQWRLGILITRPPGNSLWFYIISVNHSCSYGFWCIWYIESNVEYKIICNIIFFLPIVHLVIFVLFFTSVILYTFYMSVFFYLRRKEKMTFSCDFFQFLLSFSYLKCHPVAFPMNLSHKSLYLCCLF